MKKTRVLLFLSVFGFSALLSYLAVALYLERAARETTLHELTIIKEVFSTGDLLRYGIVESVDPAKKTLLVRLPDRYAIGSIQRLQVHVSENAVVARQSLFGSGDAFDSVSPTVPATLSDIRPGERVALRIRREKDAPVAYVVLFGNPL